MPKGTPLEPASTGRRPFPLAVGLGLLLLALITSGLGSLSLAPFGVGELHALPHVSGPMPLATPSTSGPHARAPAMPSPSTEVLGGVTPANLSASTWTELGVPPAREFATSAVDYAAGYTLVFGGNGSRGYLGDTWTVSYDYANNVWNNQLWADWSQVPTTVAPSPRMAGAMAYDAFDGTMVLFGGYNGTYLGDTWVYNSGVWTELRSSTAPSPRAYASMTWDNTLDEVILFGGRDATQSFNDTWAYANGTWTQLHPARAPTPRYGAAFAGDPAEGLDLLFGGSNGSAETWEFAGGAWTQAAPSSSPPARMFASMIYTVTSPQIFLFGGYSGTPLGDLWQWTNGAWSCADCSGNGPSPRFGAIAGSYPLGDWPFFATGSSGGNQTWLYDGGTWTELYASGRPPPYSGSVIAYDPVTQESVFEGGYLPGGYWEDNWAFKGTNWTDLSLNNPNSLDRNDGGIVWDAADQALLYFGGWNGGPLNDTWEFNGVGWTSVSTNHGPPARYEPGMAYDPVDGYVVLFGGSNNGAGTHVLNDTWTYRDGVWTNITSTAGAPPARYFSEMAWDSRDSEIVLFGGLGPQPLNDTWVFSHGRWTEIHPEVSPAARYSGGFVYDSSTGETYLVGGSNGSPLGDLWSFAGGNWTEVAAQAPFGPLYDVLATYDDSTQNVLIYGGNAPLDSPSTYSQETWLWHPIAQPLLVTATTNVTTVEGTVPISFDGTVAGGVPPYSTVWHFGDGQESTSLVVAHTYTRPGTFEARLYVNDTIGNSVIRSVNITVDGPLSLAPSATPSRVEVGVPVSFSAGVGGGAAPLNYTWSFGDGSAPSYVAAPRHIYLSPANYTVQVIVEDALGAVVQAQLTVQVVTGPFSASAIGLPTVNTIPFAVDFTSTLTGGLPPYAVLWNFGDGNTSRQTDPVHNYTVAGTFEVKLYAADSDGHLLTRYLNITALTPAPLTINPAEAPNSGGAPLTVNFTTGASGGTGGPYTYLWNFGDGSVGEGQTTTHTYDYPGLYTPTLAVSDGGGDEATQALSPITVTATSGAPTMQVHATATPQPKVSPTLVDFTASIEGGTPPYSFLWTFGDNSTSTSATPSHSYPTPGPYTATLTVTDSAVPASNAETTLQVDVGAPHSGGLAVSVAADPLKGDSPLTVSFAAVASGGSGAYPYYLWTFGDGQNQTGPYANHVYTSAGIYEVHMFVTDSVGDTASVFLNVTVETATVTVTITTSSSTGPAPLPVSFEATATGGTGVGYTYAWTFGDQSTAAGPDVVHTYDDPGSFTVTVKVTDSGKNMGSSTVTVDVTVPSKSSTTPTFLGLPVTAWYIIGPLIAVVALMAGVLILVLRRPMMLATTKEEEAAPPTGPLPEWPSQPLTVLETTEESGAYTMAATVPKADLLVVSRQPPETLAQEKGFEASNVWQLAVSEGENRIRPADLEKIGHLIEQHLSGGQNRAVVITGVDMLLDATSLKSVRRLFAVARELADEHHGRVLVALNPKGLKDDRVHLEEGATVIRH